MAPDTQKRVQMSVCPTKRTKRARPALANHSTVYLLIIIVFLRCQ